MSTAPDLNDHMIQVTVPDEHYSNNPNEPLFFYGGPFSNFVTEMSGEGFGGDKHLWIVAEHKWFDPNASGYSTLLEKVTYGVHYRTVEHFFQAAKAQDYDDHEWVRAAWHPKEAKRRGRTLRLRPDWDDVKFEYMLLALRVKFGEPGSFMANFLLATGDRFIAEDSPSDDVWGIRDRQGGFTGQNLLGKALMTVRRELRERQEAGRETVSHIVAGSEALAQLEAVVHAPTD